MKKIPFLLSFLLISQLFFAQSTQFLENYGQKAGKQTLIDRTHWIYDALNALALEAGSISWAQNTPLTIQELECCFYEIPTEKLSKAGLLSYKKIELFFKKRYIAFGIDAFNVHIDPILQPQLFLKTTPSTEIWEKNENNYYKRAFPLLLPIRFTSEKWLTIELQPYIGQNYWKANNGKTITNIPFSGMEFDSKFPQFSYGSIGFGFEHKVFANFKVAMIPQTIGRTLLGSLFINNTSRRNTTAQFTVFSSKLRYTMDVMSYDLLNPLKRSKRYLYLHRFEAKPFNNFSISLIEGVLVPSAFEIRFLNPALIFHSLESWSDYGSGVDGTGSFLVAMLSYNPWKYMRLYFLWGQNQIQTLYEENNSLVSDSKIPNSIAAQGGIESSIPYKNGYFNAQIEGIYTSPWMYIMATRQISYYSEYMELVSPIYPASSFVGSWLGFPYGPDAIAATARFGYTIHNNWSAHINYRFLALGENGEKWGKGQVSYPQSKAEAQMISPTGMVEYSNRITISGSKKVFSWLSIKAQTSWTVFSNYKHQKDILQHVFEGLVSVTIFVPQNW